MPVPYSPLMNSAPRTPMASTVKIRPLSGASIGWKVARSDGLHESYWWTAIAEMRAAKPTVRTMAMPSVQGVERTERNFVHSERMTRAWVTFGAGAGVVEDEGRVRTAAVMTKLRRSRAH